MLKEQLQATRKIVEAGWTQRFYATSRFVSAEEQRMLTQAEVLKVKGDSHHCLVGSVSIATGSLFYTNRKSAPVLSALKAQLPHPLCDDECAARPLLNWNDKIGRTKEEVLDLIDKAIAQCDSPPNNSNT